jgi:hypothetical protein
MTGWPAAASHVRNSGRVIRRSRPGAGRDGVTPIDTGPPKSRQATTSLGTAKLGSSFTQRARPRYHGLAVALGGHGERVERTENLRPALRRAFDSGVAATSP